MTRVSTRDEDSSVNAIFITCQCQYLPVVRQKMVNTAQRGRMDRSVLMCRSTGGGTNQEPDFSEPSVGTAFR